MRTSNDHTRLPIVLRPDLQFADRDADDPHHAIKDPVSLNYFLLRREEAAVLQMLDGKTTIADIKRMYDHRFAPTVSSSSQILAFISQAHRNGLLIAQNVDQAEQLLQKGRFNHRQQLASRFLNPLVIRWRGINPDRILNSIHPKVQWVFCLPVILACACLIGAAILLATLNMNELNSRLPEFYSIFAAQNVILLLCTFVSIKILHELGHALTCKHFGGEVHELGVILVVGMPLLYCNVTDAWMFRSRWHRIAVSGAGILVELTIAAVAMFAWWCTEPGAVNAISRSAMLVCSVNTILANGNPLLRFDGYFVLSDLLRVPNLWTQSRSLVYHHLCRIAIGVSPFAERALPSARQGGLVAYGVASMLYRTVVIAALFVFAFSLFAFYEVAALFPLFAFAAVCGLLLGPTNMLLRMGSNPVFRQRVKKPRFAAAAVFLSGIVVVVGVLPIPARIRATATIAADDATTVYVASPGILTESRNAGDVVRAGDTIAKLRNYDMASQIEKGASDVAVQQARVRMLIATQMLDDEARRSLPTARQELQRAELQLRELRLQADKAIITAPADGVILADYRPAEHIAIADRDRRLAKWNGCALDEANSGCFLETGTICCSVGSPDEIEAVLLLDERDIRRIAKGQLVKLRIPGLARTLGGVVAGVSRRATPHEARDLAANHLSKIYQPIQTLYEARVQLEPGDVTPPVGVTAQAVIAVAPRTIAGRIVESLRRAAKS